MIVRPAQKTKPFAGHRGGTYMATSSVAIAEDPPESVQPVFALSGIRLTLEGSDPATYSRFHARLMNEIREAVLKNIAAGAVAQERAVRQVLTMLARELPRARKANMWLSRSTASSKAMNTASARVSMPSFPRPRPLSQAC